MSTVTALAKSLSTLLELRAECRIIVGSGDSRDTLEMDRKFWTQMLKGLLPIFLKRKWDCSSFPPFFPVRLNCFLFAVLVSTLALFVLLMVYCDL